MPTTERKAMIKKIWISRDQNSDDLSAWTREPEDCLDGWGNADSDLVMDCSQSQLFLKRLLGSAWIDEGSFCVEITIASILPFKSPYQTIVDKLRKMTKANFRKATIAEAIKLLE